MLRLPMAEGRVPLVDAADRSAQVPVGHVGAKNSATLCDLRVFVDQPAEAVTSDDLDIVLDQVGKGS